MNFRDFSSLDNKFRTKAFRKDKIEESFFQDLNDNLIAFEKHLSATTPLKKHPIILVIGAPRSGTTLLFQSLVYALDVGYPSNLMARFYETPSIGARLHKTLIKDSFKTINQFKSVHGVTQRIDEPHEFGYFWARHFNIGKDVHEPSKEDLQKLDLERLKKELYSMTSVFDKPIVLKCPLGVYFLEFLSQVPEVYFLFTSRNFENNKKSILKARKERLGDEQLWWSIRPKEYHEVKKLNPSEQVDFQLNSILKSIEHSERFINVNRKFRMQYEQFCLNPNENIFKFFELISRDFQISKPINLSDNLIL